VVEDNVFVGNTAMEGGGVRFCFFYGPIPEPAIRRNTLLDNEASMYGGGIAVNAADPVIENCTLDGNSAGVSGGGFYATECTEAPELRNSIIANSTSGGGVAAVDAPVTTAFCDVWNNTGGDYVGCAPGPTDFSVNPLYCGEVSRDLTLRDDSCCLPENNTWGVLVGAHGAGECGTSVAQQSSDEVTLRLHTPYPNPSGGPVTLSYELAVPAGAVELTVLTVGGRVVRRLPASPGTAGRHEVVWDARDAHGRPVAAGAYLVRGRACGATGYCGIVIVRR
jgi:predicted outer membrane repeat protein